MSTDQHWETVYQNKAFHQVSWFQAHAALSLALIQGTGLKPETARIIDVGAGASVLVDDLLDAGFRHLTALDIAEPALAISQTRLAERATLVTWRVGDITRTPLPEAGYDLWHDRAVFHFLTQPEDRARYVAQVSHALQPGGYLVIATFAQDGPEQCSNLAVCRYTPESLLAELGPHYTMLKHATETHVTPSGKTQAFVYCLCQRTA